MVFENILKNLMYFYSDVIFFLPLAIILLKTVYIQYFNKVKYQIMLYV